VVLAPLAVVVEPNEPQLPVGAQLQVTLLPDSFDTEAPTVATAVTAMVEGGAGCRAIETAGGVTALGAADVPPPHPARARMQPKRHSVGKNRVMRSGAKTISDTKR